MKVEVEKITSLEHAKEGINFSKKGMNSKLKNLTKIYASEHSPMYSQIYIIRLFDIPGWVHTHIRTHKKNFIFESVTTSRPDRTGKQRDPNDTVNMIIYCNAKTIVDMMIKRLCSQASFETQEVFIMIRQELKKQEDELVQFCVPKCIYRNGLCGEFEYCGYNRTNGYRENQIIYNKNFKLWEV